MSAVRVERPIVRSFVREHATRAAAHARAGGHSIVWETPGRALLVVRRIDPDDDHDLGLWSMMDLGKERPRAKPRGVFAGLSVCVVPRDAFDIVRARAERDSAFAGPTRTISLDCVACAACCRDNEVLLYAHDVALFRRHARADLARPPWTRRRRDGKLVLVLSRDRRCKQLGRDNRCGIYEIRPTNCRVFPPGSECCLGARQEELGWSDSL